MFKSCKILEKYNKLMSCAQEDNEDDMVKFHSMNDYEKTEYIRSLLLRSKDITDWFMDFNYYQEVIEYICSHNDDFYVVINFNQLDYSDTNILNCLYLLIQYTKDIRLRNQYIKSLDEELSIFYNIYLAQRKSILNMHMFFKRVYLFLNTDEIDNLLTNDKYYEYLIIPALKENPSLLNNYIISRLPDSIKNIITKKQYSNIINENRSIINELNNISYLSDYDPEDYISYHKSDIIKLLNFEYPIPLEIYKKIFYQKPTLAAALVKNPNIKYMSVDEIYFLIMNAGQSESVIKSVINSKYISSQNKIKIFDRECIGDNAAYLFNLFDLNPTNKLMIKMFIQIGSYPHNINEAVRILKNNTILSQEQREEILSQLMKRNHLRKEIVKVPKGVPLKEHKIDPDYERYPQRLLDEQIPGEEEVKGIGYSPLGYVNAFENYEELLFKYADLTKKSFDYPMDEQINNPIMPEAEGGYATNPFGGQTDQYTQLRDTDDKSVDKLNFGNDIPNIDEINVILDKYLRLGDKLYGMPDGLIEPEDLVDYTENTNMMTDTVEPISTEYIASVGNYV